jgi:hypothetical protein
VSGRRPIRAVIFDSYLTMADPRPTTETCFAGLLECLCPGVTIEQFAGERDAIAGRWVNRPAVSFCLDPDSGLQAGHHVLTVQWQGRVRRVIWPPNRTERQLILREG